MGLSKASIPGTVVPDPHVTARLTGPKAFLVTYGESGLCWNMLEHVGIYISVNED